MSDIDTLIGLAIDDVEGQNEIHRNSKRAQAILGPPKRQKEPAWSVEELKFLEANSIHIGDEGVAKVLGRSLMGVKVNRTRLGIKSPTRNDHYFTANKAAYILNIDSHAIMELIERGLIHFEIAPVREKRIYRISRHDLLVWAVNPNNWPYFLSNSITLTSSQP